jgi:hypothetical protein
LVVYQAPIWGERIEIEACRRYSTSPLRNKGGGNEKTVGSLDQTPACSLARGFSRFAKPFRYREMLFGRKLHEGGTP